MWRTCEHACHPTNTSIAIWTQSRRRRVNAKLQMATLMSTTNGQNTGSLCLGAAHSVISGRGLPSDRISH